MLTIALLFLVHWDPRDPGGVSGGDRLEEDGDGCREGCSEECSHGSIGNI